MTVPRNLFVVSQVVSVVLATIRTIQIELFLVREHHSTPVRTQAYLTLNPCHTHHLVVGGHARRLVDLPKRKVVTPLKLALCRADACIDI
jgi:hypothetical protein